MVTLEKLFLHLENHYSLEPSHVMDVQPNAKQTHLLHYILLMLRSQHANQGIIAVSVGKLLLYNPQIKLSWPPLPCTISLQSLLLCQLPLLPIFTIL